MGSSTSTPISTSDGEETGQIENSSKCGPSTRRCRCAKTDDLGSRTRVRFGTGAGASVYAFPSKGGVYHLHCSPMELDFLGLDRFESAPPSSDPADEDALCAKMRLLGAVWWPSLGSLRRVYLESWSYRATPLEKVVRFLGVASQGGAWALETSMDDCIDRQLGRIHNARDMEERCRQIERFGGTFHADPSDCPLLDFESPVPERAAIHVLFAGDARNQTITRDVLTRLVFSQVTTVGAARKRSAFF